HRAGDVRPAPAADDAGRRGPAVAVHGGDEPRAGRGEEGGAEAAIAGDRELFAVSRAATRRGNGSNGAGGGGSEGAGTDPAAGPPAPADAGGRLHVRGDGT